ncbi:DNA cytosine methyltransferase [Leptospira alexanderi]|uniref:DNA cytosine methyltransferase n=1 Tax=Leptospira alexanderi TaxID=100053 RepID=UPI00111567C5|nr:DNA cytosine methyltransferase [Leptospira alexanderi]
MENSPLLTRRGIEVVLGSLASMGYDAIWGVLGADDVGAPHIRKRIWILAYIRSERTGDNPDRLVCQDGSPPLWPTPTVSGNNNRKGASKKSGDGLATAVKKFPTPRANSGSGPSRVGHRTDLQTQAGGPLNPNWVEWLMGWPIGWSDLRPLGMDKFRQWLNWHGKC